MVPGARTGTKVSFLKQFITSEFLFERWLYWNLLFSTGPHDGYASTLSSLYAKR